MSGTLSPRLVLVTRETEYDALMVRHATPGQARAFLKPRGQSLDTLSRRRSAATDAVATVRAALPKGWRIAAVRRAELDRFLFAPEDVVVAVGADGLVANLAKYLRGQPVIGVNADPERNPGILVPHAPDDVAALLPLAAAGRVAIEHRTMIRAELDDGQALLALNEIFVGHASHQSARYAITFEGREELQSSSGLIVASGTGATGWALSIARATGLDVALAPGERVALFLVREPWPSRATGTTIVSGRLGPSDRLLLASRMNEGGVVFADGIEHDRLDFGWGRTLAITVAAERLSFVPGRAPGRAAAPSMPVRRAAAPARPVASAPRAPVPAGTRVAAPTTPPSQRSSTARTGPHPLRRLGLLARLRLLLLLGATVAIVATGVRSCSWPSNAPANAPDPR